MSVNQKGVNPEERERLKAMTDKVKKEERAENKKNKASEIPDIEVDEIIEPPKPTPDMFHGLVGEVARIASTGTEINPVAAAMVFLSFLGANVGRDTFLLINNTYHHPRLFTMHIGRSSRGGKGDSQQLTRRIMSKINNLEPELLGKLHTGGLSSGEGLAAMIHDGYGETPPIHDKRIFVIEGELANVLNKMRREGNVLSSTLREMWDGSDIKPAVKTRPMGVTDPHIGVHACITPAELTSKLGKGEMDNGFANRFLMIFSENTGCVPLPEPTCEYIIHDLAYLTIDVIKFALGNYPDTSNSQQMHLSQAAKVFYGQIYRHFKNPLDNEVIAGLLARRAPYTIRLAMMFALVDKMHVIEVRHLKAAFAWIEYFTDTVRFVFHSARQTEKDKEIKRNASKILTFLEQSKSGYSSSDIYRLCFKGHLDSAKRKEALNYLLMETPPLIESVKNTTKGRPKTVYKVKNSAQKAQKVPALDIQGLQGKNNLRINAQKGAKSPPENHEKGLNAHYCASENDLNKPYNPHGTAFCANALNAHYVKLGENQELPENEEINATPEESLL